MIKLSKINIFCEHFAKKTTEWAGSTNAIIMAYASILIWTICGFFEGFSSEYQMIVNSGTTVITFLTVFTIQRSQNKDSQAIHLKLNELLAAHPQASNRMIGIERLSEKEVRELWVRFMELADKTNVPGGGSHSIEEIEPSPNSVIKWAAEPPNREQI